MNKYLIVGLGNPGKEYDNTRHNIGFDVIDSLLNKLNLKLDSNKYNGIYTKTIISENEIYIAKPMTYMNLSGNFIAPLINFFKIDINNILVIYDDKDMELGKTKLRPKGSSGGHNGIKSIISSIGTENFKRLKIGIGSPKNKSDVINFVIGKFTKDELQNLKPSIDKSLEIIEDFPNKDFTWLMNRYN